ncbi:MAG: monofunctional biosynthetic peptidoglycan transglycosylase [Cyclonatronaceae bacterium]
MLLLLCSVVALRWVNPAFTSFTLREDWENLNRERHNLREYWVKADELPDHLKWAVIASEDQRFYEHSGLDWMAIETALDERNRGIRQRGASTITQQVAKNLYLWPGQSWVRKGLEAGISVLIELFWNKDRIMEMYLNIAEFGPGLYGAGKATSIWYGKAPTGLSPVESARMAAVLSSPKRMRVEPPSPYTIERSSWILQQIKQITGTEYRPVVPDEPSDTTADTIRVRSDIRINPFNNPGRNPDSLVPPAGRLKIPADSLN